MPEKLIEQLTTIRRSAGRLGGCGCQTLVFDDLGNLLATPLRQERRSEIISNLLYRDENIVPSTLIFERSKFLDLGGYREDMPVSEDCEFLLRFLLKHDFTVLPRPLVKFTEHKGSRLTRDFAAGFEGEAKYCDFVIENKRQLAATKRDLGYRHAKVGHRAMLAGKWWWGLKEFATGLLLYPWDRRISGGALLSLLGPSLYFKIIGQRMGIQS